MHTPGPWTYDHRSGWINADHCCERGAMHVADIRGWGHLTGKGHGAHGMTTDEGIAIQAANARAITAVPDFMEAAALMTASEQSGGDLWWKGFEMLKAAFLKAGGQFPSMHDQQ